MPLCFDIIPPAPPHPHMARFAVSSSSSFKELSRRVRDAISWLHDDYYFRCMGCAWGLSRACMGVRGVHGGEAGVWLVRQAFVGRCSWLHEDYYFRCMGRARGYTVFHGSA